MRPEGGLRRRAGRGPEDGFGLVEVLVAVVVLAAGVLGLASLSAGVAALTGEAQRETAGALVARQLLDSLRAAGYRAAASGSAERVQWGRRWRASWSVDEPRSGLKRVDLRLRGEGEAEARLAAARLLRPVVPPGSDFRGGGGGP